MEANVSDLIGKTLVRIENDQNLELIFHCSDGDKFKLFHDQDCWESVTIDDICGDLEDLIGNPILVAEEITNEDFIKEFENKVTLDPNAEGWGSTQKKDSEGNYEPESCTWTFYKFATKKGYIDIRWFGTSNGNHSEGVDFYKANAEGNFNYWD